MHADLEEPGRGEPVGSKWPLEAMERNQLVAQRSLSAMLRPAGAL